MQKPSTVYVGLGSNLGDRENYIKKALENLAKRPDIKIAGQSDLIQTSPLGGVEQPDYINAVGRVETTLSARDFFVQLMDTEKTLGRIKGKKWSSRPIDLDLLLFDSEVIHSPELTVPHPQMHLRSFVLKGLCQLDSKLVHPVLKVTVKELLQRLGGRDFVLEPDRPQLINIAGNIGVGKTTLTRSLSEILNCKFIFEEYGKNPFMPEVYAGKRELALDSQLFFLTSRSRQLYFEVLAPGQIAVSDYIFEKELIYAKRLLNEKQLALYDKIYHRFENEHIQPVLVIYLKDSVENCLKRIRKRNRPYEQGIEPDFLEKLGSDYDEFFKGWKNSPVVKVNMSQFEASVKSDLLHLVNQVKCYIVV